MIEVLNIADKIVFQVQVCRSLTVTRNKLEVPKINEGLFVTIVTIENDYAR